MSARLTRFATFALAVVAVFAFAWVLLRRPPTAPVGQVTNDYIGRAAPPFALKSLDGVTVSLDDLKGKVVVLDLWATWCPPCVAELPHVTAVAAKYADSGVAFYAINMAEPQETVKAFLQKHGLKTPVLLDPSAATGEAYGAQYIPLLVVIDRAGRIVSHDNVDPASAEATLTKWIESALASGQAR